MRGAEAAVRAMSHRAVVRLLRADGIGGHPAVAGLGEGVRHLFSLREKGARFGGERLWRTSGTEMKARAIRRKRRFGLMRKSLPRGTKRGARPGEGKAKSKGLSIVISNVAIDITWANINLSSAALNMLTW